MLKPHYLIGIFSGHFGKEYPAALLEEIGVNPLTLEKLLVDPQLVKRKRQLLKQFSRQYIKVDKSMSNTYIGSSSACALEECKTAMSPAKRHADDLDSHHEGPNFKNRCQTRTKNRNLMVNSESDSQNVERPSRRNRNRENNLVLIKAKLYKMQRMIWIGHSTLKPMGCNCQWLTPI